MSSFGQFLLQIWCWVSCGALAASPEASSPLASFGVCLPVLQGLVCPLQSPPDQDKPESCSLLSVSLNNAHVNCRLTLGCVVSCLSHRACPCPPFLLWVLLKSAQGTQVYLVMSCRLLVTCTGASHRSAAAPPQACGGALHKSLEDTQAATEFRSGF